MALALLVSIAQAGVAHAEGLPVAAWMTTADQRHLLARQPDRSFSTTAAPAAATVDVDDARVYQEIDGFGAALTESSAWLLANELDTTTRAAVMARLFDPTDGIGLSYLRVPMGASDFAPTAGTYDDVPSGQQDPTLARFSIARDRASVLPVLKQALALNPRLKLMATPWSAPAWMKSTGTLNGGSLRPNAHAAYAAYFVRFVQAYQQEGIAVDAVTLQNEPRHETSAYPSMRLEAAQATALVKEHLGPAFARAGLATKIVGWDHNWSEVDYPLELLADPAARKYVAGSAFHCYAGDVSAQSRVHDAHPDKDVYFTECSGGDWSPDFGTNLKWNVKNLVIGATRNWARTVVLWNLALDEDGGPRSGGCPDCRGVVTVRGPSDVAANVEFYALAHASKFVVPGARRIGSTGTDTLIDNVAFRNPDGSRILLLLNSGDADRSVTVRSGGQSFVYTLPAGAVVTFTWLGA